MKFPADPIPWPDGRPTAAIPFTTCCRWESSGGLWRVQVDAVLFGYRVHVDRGYPLDSIDATPIPGMRPMRWPGHEVVYCCGGNRLALMLVPRLVMRILDRFDEGARVDAVRDAFPQQRRKPFENDPGCWTALCDAGGVPWAGDLFFGIKANADTVAPLPQMAALLSGAAMPPREADHGQ